MAAMTGKVISMPAKLLAMLKNGSIRGSHMNVTMFQSKVGRGLKPRPPTEPVMTASLALLGAIQVIQLKRDRAGKM